MAYTYPRAVKSLLYVETPLALNRLTGTPPDGMLDVGATPRNPATPAPTPSPSHAGFTHPELVAGSLAGYDELIVDLKPVVTAEAMGGSTSRSTEPYRMLQLAGKKFWLVVRGDGYGVSDLRTRNLALQAALAVMASQYNDLLLYQIEHLLAGFAVTNVNLNVVFADGTSVDRAFQNELVGACHGLYSRPAMFLSTRPSDGVTLVGPEVTGAASSKKSLLYPELGRRSEIADVIVALYPEPSPAVPNVSTLIAQVGAFMAAYGINRVPRALEWGVVLEMQSLGWTADEAGGTLQSESALARLRNVAAFVAALGVTRIAVQPAPGSNLAVPASAWAPSDDRVNTSRAFTASSQGGYVSVSYAAAGVPVTRRFDALTLEELP